MIPVALANADMCNTRYVGSALHGNGTGGAHARISVPSGMSA